MAVTDSEEVLVASTAYRRDDAFELAEQRLA